MITCFAVLYQTATPLTTTRKEEQVLADNQNSNDGANDFEDVSPYEKFRSVKVSSEEEDDPALFFFFLQPMCNQVLIFIF